MSQSSRNLEVQKAERSADGQGLVGKAAERDRYSNVLEGIWIIFRQTI